MANTKNAMSKDTWTDKRFPEFTHTVVYHAPDQAKDKAQSELTIPCPLDGQPVKIAEGVCWVCGSVVRECGGGS